MNDRCPTCGSPVRVECSGPGCTGVAFRQTGVVMTEYERHAVDIMRKAGEHLIALANRIESGGWECYDGSGGLDLEVLSPQEIIKVPVWGGKIETSDPSEFVLVCNIEQKWRKVETGK